MTQTNCPHCGSTINRAVTAGLNGMHHFVTCTNEACGASTGVWPSEDEAVQRWASDKHPQGCPACGSHEYNVRDSGHSRFYAECRACRWVGPLAHTRDGATEAMERRKETK